MNKDWQTEQNSLCERFNSHFAPISPDARIGIALQTLNQRPLHGLRHPPHGNMSGWYIWGGEYSKDPSFFQVIHAEHFSDQCPNLIMFLSLPPGSTSSTPRAYP